MRTMHKTLAIALLAALAGCSDSKGGGGNDNNDLVFEGDVTGGCPEFADREFVEIEGEITADTTWGCDTAVLLTGRTFVTENATLTVEDGTWVFAEEGAALIVTKGAKLAAKGEATSPVVFTSALPRADRARGDWGGVVLLGGATINVPGGTNQIEGLEVTDVRGEYGGEDDAFNCGSIEYTRIEYAGDEFSIDNELNGLTLGACGTGTKLSHIQIHMGLDDGIEFFGGTANVDHLVITGAMDDGFDWDEGWRGEASFVVVQIHAGTGDNAIEADNLEDNNDASPRSAPTLRNLTLIGSNEAETAQRGILLRRGTYAIVQNSLLLGFGGESIDIRDEATVTGTDGDEPALRVERTHFFEIGGPGADDWFAGEPTDGSEEDDDAGFVESDFFALEAFGNTFGEDPNLGAPYSATAPDFAPMALIESDLGEETGADFNGAAYVGAIDPGGDDWTTGWTSYE
jgi:hypothetical protein